MYLRIVRPLPPSVEGFDVTRFELECDYDLSAPLSDLLIVGGYAVPAEGPPHSREAAIKAIANAVVAADPAPGANRPDERVVVANESAHKRSPSATAPRGERRASQRADRRKASRSGRRAADPAPEHLDSAVTKSKRIGMARSASEQAKTGIAESEAAPDIARSLHGHKGKQ
jgi:hypothetical protein